MATAFSAAKRQLPMAKGRLTRCNNAIGSCRKRDDLQVLVRKTIRIAPDGRGGKTVTVNKHRDEACHGSALVADRFDRDFGSKLKHVDLTLDEGNGR
ncbi:hypothetical protein INS49_012212 [Diaporthe citri]|uniref:uncharacterized protein n=1 Tax=Diaporthe citri TaxID=83186 RepID=UPI001C7E94EA|nr:uncharacterized protein INS49_012212 [Diaporthe citri]KAG6358694.1 hypothetical protein INS49_012212 [Diaporthe citri]